MVVEKKPKDTSKRLSRERTIAGRLNADTVEILNNWKNSGNDKQLRSEVLKRIDKEKAFSDYVKLYLNLLMGMVCQKPMLNVQIGSEQHQTLMLSMLDQADIYRGFHAIDEIKLPPQAIPFLDIFCGSTHDEVLVKLAERFILKREEPRFQMVICHKLQIARPEANDETKKLARQIELSIHERQDVRSYKVKDLEKIDKNFATIIISMREVDGTPFTYGVRELLRGACKLALHLSKKHDTWTSYHYQEAALYYGYHGKYYDQCPLIGATAGGIHKFFALSSDPRKASKEHASLQANDAQWKEHTTRSWNSRSDSEGSETMAPSEGSSGTRSESEESDCEIDCESEGSEIDSEESVCQVLKEMEKLTTDIIRKVYRFGDAEEKMNVNLADNLTKIQNELQEIKRSYNATVTDSWPQIESKTKTRKSIILSNTFDCFHSVLFLQNVADLQSSHIESLKDVKINLNLMLE